MATHTGKFCPKLCARSPATSARFWGKILSKGIPKRGNTSLRHRRGRVLPLLKKRQRGYDYGIQRPHPVCAVAHRLHACGQPAHRTVHLSAGPPQRRRLHPAHRGHRPGPPGGRRHRHHLRYPARHRPDLGRRPRCGRSRGPPMCRASAWVCSSSTPSSSSRQARRTTASAPRNGSTNCTKPSAPQAK